MIVYTIGYDRRGFGEFAEILRRFGILRIVDVRRWAKSVRAPEYSAEHLSRALQSLGVEYYWIPELGGYRRFGVDVEDLGIATCFESLGFRAYATYITLSPAAKPHLDRLVQLVSEKTSAVMCREKLPWMCHRKILADYLTAKSFIVIHIIDADRAIPHRLHECARVVNGELVYT